MDDQGLVGFSGARLLFAIVIIGVILYVLFDILAQALPPHYSLVSDSESDLAVGPYGFIMAVNFVNRGTFSLVFLYAILEFMRKSDGSRVGRLQSSTKVGSALFGIWGIGSAFLAIFPTDVPPTPVSWHGNIHLAVAALAFLCGALGPLILSFRFETPQLRGAMPFSIAIAFFALGSFFILSGTISSPVVGLTERLFLGSVLLWITYVSAYVIRQKPTN